MYFVLFYTYRDDYLQRREPLRQAHLELASAAHQRGDIFMAGAFVEPPFGAVLIFKTDDVSKVERFVEQDPYVKNGLVADWQIRPWSVAIGG
ncbi:MAG: YciI-like protein [Myxococcota bacterium]|nr:YciI-like protein [Myxococcota bacterium]